MHPAFCSCILLIRSEVFQHAVCFPIIEVAYCDFAIREVANVRKRLPLQEGSCNCTKEVVNQ